MNRFLLRGIVLTSNGFRDMIQCSRVQVFYEKVSDQPDVRKTGGLTCTHMHVWLYW